MSPVFNTEVPVNKNSKENFLYSKEIPLRCSVLTQLCQISTVSLRYFFEHGNIIPDISVSLEYFISAGEQSYFVISPVGGQLHQFLCLASNISHNQLISFSTRSGNYSGHFGLFRIFCIVEGTSPFSHKEYLYLQKRIWCASSNTALFCLVLFFIHS